ncbi:hypothetical protein GCM10023223_25220 [Stackebrandtia albiflava]
MVPVTRQMPPVAWFPALWVSAWNSTGSPTGRATTRGGSGRAAVLVVSGDGVVGAAVSAVSARPMESPCAV